MSNRKKAIFITPYPEGEAPSQRFRLEQYFSALQSNQIDFKLQPFLTQHDWRIFYKKGQVLNKIFALAHGFYRRITGFVDVWQADIVFIHREAAPIGPPIVEWIIRRVLRKKIIYDFDDAIWLTDQTHESSIARWIKWRRKVVAICKMADKISCGNEFLRQYASQFSSSVILIPTSIDTSRHQLSGVVKGSQQLKKDIVIGWTGSRSTLKYLYIIEDALKALEETFPHVVFIVIADVAPTLALKRLSYISWNVHTEIEDLAKIDIGIMPLPDDEWAKGKCGFKILQYMALSMPSVSSPVGVNTQIVQHGINGYLAESEQDWVRLLSALIENADLRQEMGAQGRQTVVQRYSVNSNTPTFLSLFE